VDEGLRLLEAALGMAEAHGDAQEQMRGYWNLFANTFSAARWAEALAASRPPPSPGPGSARATSCPPFRQTPPTASTGSGAGTRPSG
jgi:hypothetical protein